MTMRSSPRENARRILIVDDDELMSVLYTRLFRRHAEEFVCRIERSVGAALKHLKTGKVDAAVLDWDLPGIDGLALLKALRSNPATKALPIMIVSGRCRPEDHVAALDRGADDFLTKPFDVGVLMARLRRLLRSRD